MSERVLLKLGGSVITDKSQGRCVINQENLNFIGRVIGRAEEQELVLVHGAGSCGHPEAKEHQLDKGLTPIHKAGIFITHRAVRNLNDAVVNTLRAHGAEAIGMHPLGAGIAQDGRLLDFEKRHITLLLQYGIIPVLHGDVVMDLSRGACIISGDQLVSFLPRAIRIDRIGLATDVPGVLDGGRVVRRISAASRETLNLGRSENLDVTGGMKGKIDELLRLAADGIESSIFHISRLEDFLAAEDHGGTVVTE